MEHEQMIIFFESRIFKLLDSRNTLEIEPDSNRVELDSLHSTYSINCQWFEKLAGKPFPIKWERHVFRKDLNV